MSNSQQIETEEYLLTCLQIKLYHPMQRSKAVFADLPLGKRSKHPAEDPLRLGRDGQACNFTLQDPRVSRKHLAIQAYYISQNPDMRFSIQNLSHRGQLVVNNSVLGYLERADLPDKAIVRVGEYEMLIIREPGEARASFEVQFEVLEVSPFKETNRFAPSMVAVMESGLNAINSIPGEQLERGPSETDETMYVS